MYDIVYTKAALKDIPKLKAAHLDKTAKALIMVIKENPYRTPPSYEKLTGDPERALLTPHQHTAQTCVRGF